MPMRRDGPVILIHLIRAGRGERIDGLEEPRVVDVVAVRRRRTSGWVAMWLAVPFGVQDRVGETVHARFVDPPDKPSIDEIGDHVGPAYVDHVRAAVIERPWVGRTGK